MIMVRELTDIEILDLVANKLLCIPRDDAIALVKAAFEAARVQQVSTRVYQD